MTAARRGFALAGLVAVGLLVLAVGAFASQRISAGDVASAHKAAEWPSLRMELGRFFGASGLKQGEVATFATYQRTVAGRYGDKLAGSAYEREGRAGGFAPRVMPRDDDTQPPPKRSFDWTPLVILGGLLVMAGGAYVLHSVRRPA